MTLNEAINFIDTGYKHILLSDKNDNEYYYHDVTALIESKEYDELSKLETLSVDTNEDDKIIFYLW